VIVAAGCATDLTVGRCKARICFANCNAERIESEILSLCRRFLSYLSESKSWHGGCITPTKEAVRDTAGKRKHDATETNPGKRMPGRPVQHRPAGSRTRNCPLPLHTVISRDL